MIADTPKAKRIDGKERINGKEIRVDTAREASTPMSTPSVPPKKVIITDSIKNC